MSAKLLMFAKLSIKTFIYDLSKMFCFPTQVVVEIYKKYLIEKVLIYHILTDTDSTALQFVFASDPNSDLSEDKFKDVIFEVVITTKIYKRFNSSHEFWDIFGFRNPSRKERLGYYEVENIDNPCLAAIAVNPIEYLEVLKKIKN